MPTNPLKQLRKVCLALPGAQEVEAWGAPTFRVKNKLFAMYASETSSHTGGRPGVWVKSTLVNQDLLLQQQPNRFFKPPYVGPSGWVGIYLDKRPNWKLVAEIIEDGHSLLTKKSRSPVSASR